MKKTWDTIRFYIHALQVILTPEQKRWSALIFLMSFFGAFLQSLGVSAIIPLVSSMIDTDTFMKNRYAGLLQEVIRSNDPRHVIAVTAVLTIVLYICKNVYGIFFIRTNAGYAFRVQRELSVDVMRSYMFRPYDYFLKTDTAQVMRDIISDPAGVSSVINALFNIVSELLTIMLIIGFIIYVDILLAITIVVLAAICLLIIYKVFRRRIRDAGVMSRNLQAEVNMTLIESIEGIKDVQVLRKQSFFQKKYEGLYSRQQRAQLQMAVGTMAPAYVIEGVFVGGVLAVISAKALLSEEVRQIIPILASFAAGAIRILPSLGRISSALNTIVFTLPQLKSVYDNYERIHSVEIKRTETGVPENKDSKNEIQFYNTLVLNNITWRYPGTDVNVLQGLSLKIYKGESIGIIGRSGAGKTTLVDLLLGIHTVQTGSIQIDGKDIISDPDSWSKLIGYVPQNAYLSSRTVKENVAFGENVDDIDEERVWDVLKQAQLAEFVQGLSKGLDTSIGERGIQLSGGQRQRIAIARALYHNPQILVLDEATSALDTETEKAVMEAIISLHGKITMVIIAHRLTTVESCDRIYEITEGRAVDRT